MGVDKEIKSVNSFKSDTIQLKIDLKELKILLKNEFRNKNRMILKRISIKRIKILFNSYNKFVNASKNEFKWYINKDFFDNEELYQKYFSENIRYKYIFDDNSDYNLGLKLNSNIVKGIKKAFDNYVENCKTKKESEIKSSDIDSFSDENDIPGFYSLEKWNEKFEKIIVEDDEIALNTYIPKTKITAINITNMVHLLDDKPNFKLNSNLTLKGFDDNLNILHRVKLRLKNKIDLSIDVIGKYEYKCPECKTRIYLSRTEMGAVKIKHYNCREKLLSNGNYGSTEIAKNSWTINSSLKLFLYEVECYDEEGKLERKSKYFYSFEDNLIRGEFFVDVANINGGLTSPTDKETRTIMFGIKTSTPKILSNLINVDDGKKLANKFNLPFSNFFIYWASAIKYFESRNVKIIPTKGGLLQFYLITNGIARMLNYRHFNIMVIGDTSVSKTFPAKLLGRLFDINYIFTSGKKSVTYPGIWGGINNSLSIGGKKPISVFQEGSAGGGTVVFDEGENFLNEDFNGDLKSIQNDEITIMKIGGKTVKQRFTPVIFTNFLNYHNGGIDSYEGNIKRYYWKIVKDKDLYLKKTDADFFITKKNLYLPLQMFSDENVREAVAIVRHNYRKKDICWWSGGSVPTQNRFLFDTVVKLDKIIKKDNPFENIQEVEVNNIYHIATVDFCKTIEQSIFGDYKVDFANINNNEKKVIKYFKYLKIKVKEFLNNDEDIILHLSGGQILDEKIAGLTINFTELICMINNFKTYIDNPEKLEISYATKILIKVVLLKCKRGVKLSEYNFVNHSYIPDSNIIKNNKYSSEELEFVTEELKNSDNDINEKILEKIVNLPIKNKKKIIKKIIKKPTPIDEEIKEDGKNN